MLRSVIIIVQLNRTRDKMSNNLNLGSERRAPGSQLQSQSSFDLEEEIEQVFPLGVDCYLPSNTPQLVNRGKFQFLKLQRQK